MAFKFVLVRPTDGSKRMGYFGFAWSTLLVGPLTPLARRDFGSSFLLMLSEVAICAFVFLLERSPMLLVARLGVITLSWAFLYNELHTLSLIAAGFRFEGSGEVVSALEGRFPSGGRADRIRLLRERSLVFVVIGLGCLQAIVYSMPKVSDSWVRPVVDGKPSSSTKSVSSEVLPTPQASKVTSAASPAPTPTPTATPIPSPTPTPALVPAPVRTAPPSLSSQADSPSLPAPVATISPGLPTVVPRVVEAARPPAKSAAEVLAEQQRGCDAAMGSQFDLDLPIGVKYVADTSVLPETDIDHAIASCEVARTGPGRRFNTELGRAYAARAVLLASQNQDADARDYMNKAITQWNAAESQGSGAAMNFLGAVYKGTFNSPTFSFFQPDYPKALQYWLRGDKANNLKAARNAGGMLLLGTADFPGVPQDIKKSKELLQRAINGNDMTAASLYGQALFYGYPTAVGKDGAAGIDLLIRACNAGDPSAKVFFDTELARSRRSPLLPATRPVGC